jgi:O-antigen ligase/tetratricopeptide (TPR) repeat protein
MQERNGAWDWMALARAGIAATAFAVVLAMYPYTYDPSGPIKVLLYHWAAFALAAYVLVGGWLGRVPFRLPRVFLPVLAPFAGLCVLAAALSDYPGHSFTEAGKFAVLALFYLVASQVYRTPGQVRRLMLTVCLAVALASVYGFFQHFGMDPFPFEESGGEAHTTMPATFGHPNYAAHTLVLTLIFALYLSTKRSRIWCLGLAALFLVHIRITGVRGGVLALAAAAACVGVAWLVGRRVRRPVPAAALSLLIVIALGALGLAGAMALTNYRTGSPFPLDGSLLLRYNSYFGASRMILSKPVLGYGPGVYEIENPRFWTPYEQRWFAEKNLMNQHVHNDLLEAGIDAGLPGAALYLGFIILGAGYGLVMAFSAREPDRRRLGYTYAALFVAFAVDSAFGFNLRVPVSALLIFLIAGTLDGVWSGPPPLRRDAPRSGIALAWRAGLVAAALAFAVLNTRVFQSETYLQKGRAARVFGRPELSEMLLARGEALAPWNWNFPRERGIARRYLNDFAGSAAHTERALERNPYFVPSWLALAEMRLNVAAAGLTEARQDPAKRPAALKMLDGASEAARRTLELCPPLPDAEDALGRIAALEGTQLKLQADKDPSLRARLHRVLAEAEEHFQRALDLGAKNRGKLYMMIAEARIGRGDTSGAEEAYVRAVQADPRNPADVEAWDAFARFAAQHRRPEVLREVLDRQIARAKAADPADPVVLGRLYGVLGQALQLENADPAAIARTYADAVARVPQDPRLWQGYAFAAKAAGLEADLRRSAVEAADRLTRHQQRVPPVLQVLASAWRPGGSDPAAAVEALMKLFRQRSAGADRPTLATEFGWAADALLSDLRRAELGKEERGRGILTAGMILTQAGQYPAALLAFREALPLLPERLRPLAYYHLGMACAESGRPEAAVPFLQQAVAGEPSNLNFRVHLAQALARSKRAEEARAEYARVLESGGLSPEDRARVEAALKELAPRP